jgi:hypothetical protein
MESSQELAKLRAELTQVTKYVQQGKLTPSEAADRIIHIREQIDAATKAQKKRPGQLPL